MSVKDTFCKDVSKSLGLTESVNEALEKGPAYAELQTLSGGQNMMRTLGFCLIFFFF